VPPDPVAGPAAAVEIAEEDRARAECYALVSRLFYAPPDAALLSALAAEACAPDDESSTTGAEARGSASGADRTPPDFPTAFEGLRQACRDADAGAVRQEYDDLFVAAGKAPVSPYTSGYTAPSSPDRQLVALREHLMQWGLARRDAAFEVEDHVSAICDVMRWLIEQDRPLSEQRRFFEAFVYTGLGAFCNAIDASPASSFYRAAAALARAFGEVEREAFEMHLEE